MAVSREWELTTSASEGAAIELDGAFAEYAPASFWLADPARAGAGPRPFLLMPLNEMQDEHYTVYWCKPASEAEAGRPPRHCI